ncbi:TAXI family TRAP transporter solute-binding subunit [Neptunomonas phycophila]|uniref:TAXI family TRAP transporter solute-binding subunit n=1 Tax=Neptunomonas phycophila TaxID=1572645 RepID=UPI001FEF8EE0|nr:TAXI family TRAP transporter solute-binding subunit [Neptunomonas phycophila]
MFKKIMKGLTVATLLTTAGISAPSYAAQDILIGSTSASSSHYGYFVAVSKLLNDKVPDMKSSVAETGATLDNLRRLMRNQVDIGLVTTNTLFEANAGIGGFENRQVDSKLLWIYALAPQNVVVRADSEVQSLEQLKGQSFNPGIRGSSTEATSEKVFELLSIKPEMVRGSTSDIVSAIKDNRVTGYVKSGAGLKLDASSQDIAAQTPINLLGLNESQIALLKEKLPQLSIVSVPENTSLSLTAYTTWGFGVGASAKPSLDEELAYQVVKAVMEDTEYQSTAMASIKGQNLAEMTLQYATSPLHPATVRYLTEKGYDVPASLKP